MRSVFPMVLAALLAGNLAAADVSSWQNLAGLTATQKIEVATKKDVVKGEFVRFDDRAITVRDKKGEHSMPQADVTRVTLPKRNRAVWIGVAAGGGGRRSRWSRARVAARERKRRRFQQSQARHRGGLCSGRSAHRCG